MVLYDLGYGAGLTPSWMPLAVAVVMLLALLLLWLSMRRHLKKIARMRDEAAGPGAQ